MNDEHKIFELYLEMAAEQEQAKAHVYPNGTKRWMLDNGDYHREDGPAIEYADGSKSWWLHDMQYSNAEEWAAALLMQRNQPHDENAVETFLKQIFKKDVDKAL